MKRILAVILVVLPIALGCMAQTTEETDLSYDTLVLWLDEAADILDQAIYLAAAGAAAYDPADQYAYAQGIINLVVGPDSDLYQETSQYIVREHPGLQPFIEALTGRTGFVDVIHRSLSEVEILQFASAYETVAQFLRLALDSAQKAQDTAYQPPTPSDSLLTTYAHLVVARGEISDPLLMEGFSQMANLLPSSEVWVVPGESIQEALDRLPEGGVINLVAGTYRETLIITKSVTIQGAMDFASGNPIHGQAIIKGVEWKTAILISSSNPIEVALSNVFVIDGKVGIQVMGQARLVLDRAHVADCLIGVGLSGTASGLLTDSILRKNETAVRCMESSTCELRSCFIQDNTGYEAGLMAGEQATLILDQCTINQNRGSGVHVRDDVNLTMNKCSLTRNFGYGLLVGSDVCDETKTVFGNVGFAGTITGFGNTIPGGGLSNGNWLGSMCPEDEYGFLVDTELNEIGNDSTEGGGEE